MSIPIKLGPWRPDLPDIDNPGLTVCQNVVPDVSGYRSFARPQRLAETALDSRPLGAVAGQDSLSNAFVFAGTASKLARMVNRPLTVERASIGTYYDASGVLRTALANEPRLDHHPLTGEARGAMAEAASANIIVPSSAFSGWFRTANVVLSPNAVVAPDGTMTATTVTGSPDQGAVFIGIVNGGGRENGLTYSLYLKAGTKASIPLLLRNQSNGVNLRVVSFNPVTGQLSGTDAQFGRVEALKNGWFRVSLSTATGFSDGDNVYLYAGWTGGNPPASESFTMWGAQLEAGTNVSSYIPTTTASVSRAAETVFPAGRYWTDTSRANGTYTTGPDEAWKFVEYGSRLVASNYSDHPQIIDTNSTTSAFADMTTLVRARHITTSKGFVIGGNTFDALDQSVPFRVRWSAIENPFDWNPSVTTMSDWQDIYGAGAITGVVGGEAVTIFLQRSIYRMTFVGAPIIWQFDEIWPGRGCSVPQSIITLGSMTFFLSDDGFYMVDGANVPQPIGDPVNAWFLKDADPSAYRRMSVVADPRAKLVMWSYASVNARDGEPDKMLVFNYQTAGWSVVDAACALAFQSFSLPTSLAELARYGALSDVPAPLDSSIWAGGQSFLAGLDTSGRLHSFSGPALPGLVETGETNIAAVMRAAEPRITADRVAILGARPEFHGPGDVAVTIGTRDRTNDMVRWSATSQVNREGYCPLRVEGRYHRTKLSLSGGWTHIAGFSLDAKPSGRQ